MNAAILREMLLRSPTIIKAGVGFDKPNLLKFDSEDKQFFFATSLILTHYHSI